MHSEVNLLIQHIIVQDQDGQNKNTSYNIHYGKYCNTFVLEVTWDDELIICVKIQWLKHIPIRGPNFSLAELWRYIIPHEKKSTKGWITQSKGKENENSYQKLKRSWWAGTRTHTRKQNRNILRDTAVLQESECMWAHDKDGVTRVFMFRL